MDEAKAVFCDAFVRQEPYLHALHEVWGVMNEMQISEGQTRSGRIVGTRKIDGGWVYTE